jgi:catechol 2,3-dioxygenase-like lactoylglutathione lyase family enzyme
MSKFTASAPVLLVADVMASANYFRDKLGFTYDKFWGHPPDFCMVRRDGLTIMLAQTDRANIKPHWQTVHGMWNVYLWVDDVEAMYQELTGRGVIIDYELGAKSYGVKEFGVQDLDGHDIGIGQVL